MKTLILLLLLKSAIPATFENHSRDQHVSCKWDTEFLCGDKCVSIEGGACICGNQRLGIKHAMNSFCCSNKPCTQSNGTVVCEDAKTKRNFQDCHGICQQTAVYGMDTTSCGNGYNRIYGTDDRKCYIGILACRGTGNCLDDDSDLAQCAEQLNCEEQSDGAFKLCAQVPGAMYQNYGCKSPSSQTSTYFDCVNRMDKVDILFERPMVAAKNKREGMNFNTLLEYDDEFVFCGARNVSYEQLLDAIYKYPEEPCQLKNNKSVPLKRLYRLLTQFSFEQSTKILKFQ